MSLPRTLRLPDWRNGPSCLAAAGRRLALLVVIWSAMVLPAAGQQWQVQPRVSVQASYEDNITLEPDDPESGVGASLSAAALALRSSEASRLVLSAGLRLNEFVDNNDLDNATAFIAADWSYQMPRSELQLYQSFTTQSTLTSEASTTGVTGINRQQYRFRFRPDWSYRLDEATILFIRGAYEDVFYDDVDQTPLYNFRSGLVSLGASRRLTERLALNLAASYGRFEPQGRDRDTESVSAQLGADYQISETFSISALAGLRQTEVAVTDAQGRRITDDSSGPTYSLSVQKELADGSALRALAARELIPSGAAEVLDSTSLQLGYLYPLNERLSFSLSSQLYRNRQLVDQSLGTDRDYAEARVGLSYRARPSLSLVVNYSYRWEQTDDDSRSADSNRFSVSLAWHGQ